MALGTSTGVCSLLNLSSIPVTARSLGRSYESVGDLPFGSCAFPCYSIIPLPHLHMSELPLEKRILRRLTCPQLRQLDKTVCLKLSNLEL